MVYGNGGTGVSGAFIGGDVAAQPRMPLVALELERQAKAVEHLHILISDLENRIGAVTRPQPPIAQAAGPNTPPPQAHPVAMANGLFDQNTRLEGACSRLQSLCERIEL